MTADAIIAYQLIQFLLQDGFFGRVRRGRDGAVAMENAALLKRIFEDLRSDFFVIRMNL